MRHGLRHGHLLLRLVAGLLAGVVVLAGVLLVWLMHGPVPVDFLAPYLAAALGSESRGIDVAVDHAALVLSAGPHLDLLARGVHLSQRDGGAALTLPALGVDINLRAALRGVLAPTRILLSDPALEIVRDADGSFHLGFGGGTSEDWGARLLQDFATRADRRGPLGELTDVTVRRARITLDDRALGIIWHGHDADITIDRGDAGLRGAVAFTLDVAGHSTRFQGEITDLPAAGQLVARLDIAALRPADWAAAAPALASLSALDLPLSGRLTVTLDPTRLAFTGGTADLRLGAGRLRAAVLQDGAIPVTQGSIALAYDAAAGTLAINRADFDLAGPHIALSGVVSGLGARFLTGVLPQTAEAALTVETRNIGAGGVASLWPPAVSHFARHWVVENILDGAMDHFAAQLGLHFDATATPALKLDRLSGTASFRGVTVVYMKGLPPARDVDGTASFDRATLTFLPTAGKLFGIRAKSSGTLKLTKLDTHDEQMAIALPLQGPLRDALQVLAAAPLRDPLPFALVPSRVSGAVDARLNFAFPLVHTLQASQIDFSADATLTDVDAEKLVYGRDLAGGQLRLQLDRAALRLDGTASLGGVPTRLSWNRSLAGNDPVRSRATLAATLDDAARRSLGLDFFPDAVKGPVAVDLAYSEGPAGQAAAQVQLGLGGATLAIPTLGWKKPPGTMATAKLALNFANDHLTAIRDATIIGGGVDAEVTASFGPGGDAGPTQIQLRRLVQGDTDVTGSVAPRPGGGWNVQLTGRSVDATALLAEARRPTAVEPPLGLTLKLGRVVLGPGRATGAVSGALVSNGPHWQSALIDAAYPGGGSLHLSFGQRGAPRALAVDTDNLGALLHLLDVSDTVRGGKLRLAGQAVDQGGQRVLKGSFVGSDYRLVRAPLMARVLSLASFSGMGALLRGEGIPFTHLSGNLVYGASRITFDNLQAYGGAIGVNASGTVDNAAATLDVAGTLVPAYRLNSVLGNIPVLGDLLLGGAGQGIFGANFRVAGPLANPTVSVNPLSALAPGFLRKLFLFSAPEPVTAAPPPSPP